MVLKRRLQTYLRTAVVLLVCSLSIVLLSGFTTLEKEKAYHWYQNAKYFLNVRHEPLKAYQCLEKAIDFDPDNLKIRALIKDIRKELDMDRVPTPVEKENATRWAQRGMYLKRSEDAGTLKKAIECFEKALLYNPGLVIAREALEETREKLKFTLDDEVLATKAGELVKQAEEKLGQSAWDEAASLYEEACELDTRLLGGRLKLLMLARRTGDATKEKNELSLISKIIRYTTISEAEKSMVDRTLECLVNQNQVQAALEGQGYIFAARKSSWDETSSGFFDPLPDDVLAAKRALNEAPSDLDMRKLVEDGLLPAVPACPSSGKYHLSGDGMIWCTVHGLKPPPQGALSLDDARDAHLAGKKFLEMGRPEDARKQLEKAAGLLAGDAELLNDLGVALLRLGKSSEAMKQFNEAVDTNPFLPQLFINRSAAYQALGELDNAVADLEQALSMGEDTVEVHFGLAYLATRQEDLSKALKEYVKVERLLPEDDPQRQRVEALIERLRKLKKKK